MVDSSCLTILYLEFEVECLVVSDLAQLSCPHLQVLGHELWIKGHGSEKGS
jgi:hypothetical protein